MAGTAVPSSPSSIMCCPPTATICTRPQRLRLTGVQAIAEAAEQHDDVALVGLSSGHHLRSTMGKANGMAGGQQQDRLACLLVATSKQAMVGLKVGHHLHKSTQVVDAL